MDNSIINEFFSTLIYIVYEPNPYWLRLLGRDSDKLDVLGLIDVESIAQ